MTTTRGGRDTTYTLRRESALPIQDILDPAFFDAQFLDSKKKEKKKENDMHFVFVFFHVSRRVDKGSFFFE